MLKHFRRDAEKYYEEVFAINLKVKKFGNWDIAHQNFTGRTSKQYFKFC